MACTHNYVLSELAILSNACPLFQYTGFQFEGEDNPYLELGNISPVDLISFAYQIASGMVRCLHTMLYV